MCIHFGVPVPAYSTLPNTHISLPTSHVSGTKIYKENTKTTNSDGVPKLTSIWWGFDAVHLLRGRVLTASDFFALQGLAKEDQVRFGLTMRGLVCWKIAAATASAPRSLGQFLQRPCKFGANKKIMFWVFVECIGNLALGSSKTASSQITQPWVGLCGIHVDDLIGAGTKEMDEVLDRLKKKLPFGDYRTHTIRYTGIEIRQNPKSFAIEVGQEAYVDSLEQIPTKTLGNASTPIKDPTLMRTCAGQLAWVANATRPDQAFLASFLQGIQDKGTVSHIQMFNKAVREMKQKKVCLHFPPGIDLDNIRILCISDAGWGTRANGESQGGYLLCLTVPQMFERKRSVCWLIDWQSKKLRRVVRSSVAAETLAGQNGLDGIEAFQALWDETLFGTSPKEFRNKIPIHPAALVLDSKGFFDAVTRSCCSQAISQERRLQIDYSIAKETTEKQNILVFWVNNLRMSADCLTKLKGDTAPLFEILEGGTYEITICSQSGKKQKQSEQNAETPPENA